jgi:hydroxymethylbilane synthase
MQKRLRIGTRGSALALWQAGEVARLIRDSGGLECDIVVIRTSGDERSGPSGEPAAEDRPAENVKRLFVKEIEEGLLEGRIDVAVHSAKDLPGELPDGLLIAAALERADPRDALLLPASNAARGFAAVRQALGDGPHIGTSSVRRVAQLRRAFPGAEFRPIRGNVDTRLRKLDAGDCDVLVLAAAGVNRLGLIHRLSAPLPVEVCLPAPGQGIIAVEIATAGPRWVRDAVASISDADAETALAAERAVVRALGAGCQVPLGTLATIDGQDLMVRGLVAGPGGKIIRAHAEGRRGGPVELGEKLGADLLAKGAGEFL